MPIEQWLQSNFDIVKHTNDDMLVCCPFCNTLDTKFHMHVSINKSVAHCFRCDWGGSHFRLVQEFTGAESYAEIFQQLESPTTIRDYVAIAERLEKRKEQPRALVDMPEWYHPFQTQPRMELYPYHAHIVLRYALTRLSLENIIHYGLGYCYDVDNPLALRLVIPIERGYYQARFISNKTDRKYLNPDFPIEDRLFNYEALECFESCFICEGAISAIATGRNAMATLGANGATPEQRRRLIKSRVKQFTLVVEPEQVAIDQAIELGGYLTGYGKPVRIRQFRDGDPADGGMYKEFDYGLGWRLECQQKCY